MDFLPKPGEPGVYDIGVLQPFVNSLPEGEHEHGMLMLFNLIQLNSRLCDFQATVDLVDHVEAEASKIRGAPMDEEVKNGTLHMLSLWGEMAGRDAAMTLRHFEKTLEAVAAEMHNAPTISNGADHSRLRAAARTFGEAFPKVVKLRNGAGHRAENVANLTKVKRHAVNGQRFHFGGMKGRTFTVTFEGEDRTVDLDEATSRTLANITREAYAAFTQLEGLLPPIA